MISVYNEFRQIKFWIGAIATLAVLLVGTAWCLYSWESLAVLVNLRPVYLLLLIPPTILSFVMLSATNQLVAARLGAQLLLSRWVAVVLASSFVNHILPLPFGAPLRAIYLKRCANLPYAHFASAVVGVTVVSVLMSATVGILSLPWTNLANAASGCVLLWSLTGFLFAMLLTLTLRLKYASKTSASRLVRLVTVAQDGWRDIKRSNSLLLRVAVLNVCLLAMAAIRYYFAYQAVGHQCSLPSALLLASLGSLTNIVSITPAGLGVREAVVAATEAASGGDPAVGLLAALADRAVATVIILIFGPVGLVTIARDLSACGSVFPTIGR